MNQYHRTRPSAAEAKSARRIEFARRANSASRKRGARGEKWFSSLAFHTSDGHSPTGNIKVYLAGVGQIFTITPDAMTRKGYVADVGGWTAPSVRGHLDAIAEYLG